jgi:hypothetical protein
MVKTQTAVIDGRQVVVTPLPASRGLAVLTRILDIVAPALAGGMPETAKGLNASNVLEHIRVDAAASMLFSKLTPAEVTSIARELCSSVHLDGTDLGTPAYETAFAGQLGLLVKVAKFAFTVNFGDFWQALGEMLGAARAIPASLSAA